MTAGVRRRRSYLLRLTIQAAFASTSLFAGRQFARFLAAARDGAYPLPARPPGVEGYLPITGLMGFLDWAYQGALNNVHPAATVLFLTFLAMSLLLRRAFCSWVCPIGLLSESLARAGQILLGRNLRLPSRLDLGLRGIRYLLLGFFLWAILGMSVSELSAFIGSPYNRVADIKMYMFFERMTVVTLMVLGTLAAASVLVNGAWCRYLCPYGALLGLAGWLSPARVERNEEACIDCKRCDRVCMARLPVSQGGKVGSAECTGCLDCLASCPAPKSLSVKFFHKRMGVAAFGASVTLLFIMSYSAARLTDNWGNGISDGEYIRRVSEIDSPSYAHPGARIAEEARAQNTESEEETSRALD